MSQSNGELFVDQPAFLPRPLKIICVGAGFSGLTLAYKIQRESRNSNLDLTIYEKNSDVGGTWLENVYPGVACDIPAHSYAFPFAPNPDWSAYYVSGTEVFAYIKRTVKKFNLDRNVQLNSRVLDATWNDDAGLWKVATENAQNVQTTTEAHVLINAGGFLNNPQWPKIDGISSFRGDLVHSASWQTGLEWKGKRVGLIGNGSSAIQILPQIVPDAAHVVTYIRSPTWIATPLAADQRKGGQNFAYSEEDKKHFRENPEALRKIRRDIEHRMNTRFPSVIAGSDMSEAARKVLVGLMEERLGHDPELIKRLIPSFPVSCRRITPGEGYLEALRAGNVTVRFDRVRSITAGGIALTTTDESPADEVDELDMIICATGFNVSFVPKWPVTGRHGKKLADQWGSSPEAYFGIAVPNMPNYFICCGPNTPVSQGSLTTVIDFATDYILKWCRKMGNQNIKSISVNEAANKEFNNYTQQILKRTVWAAECRSWYKNGATNGKVTGIYGGSIVQFHEALNEFRAEDFDIEYLSSNRFQFLGNGRSLKEFTGEDLGFYVSK